MVCVYKYGVYKLLVLMKYHQKHGRQGSSNQNSIEKLIKGCILPFLKKSDLRIAKNYRGITLTSIVTKIYNAVLLNHIKPTTEKILWKIQNGFQKNRSTTSQILTIPLILGVHAKNHEVTLWFIDFSRHLTPYTEGRWSKHFYSAVSPKKLSQPS